MIKLNLSKAIATTAVDKYAKIVKQLATKMEALESKGFEYLGWKDLPVTHSKPEIEQMNKVAADLQKQNVDTLVVIGIGGSYSGAKAAIDMIRGRYPMNDKGMEIVYVGESISSTDLAQKLAYVQNKKFAINVISKSGTTTEPAIAFRLFWKMLKDKVGVNNASKYIVATTDAHGGALKMLAKRNDFITFVIPENIGGRYSVLTPVGLFPMACAGINIKNVMKGALAAHKKYSVPSIENDAYKYAAARHFLSSKFSVELMVQYEPQMGAFNEWWKQLAGESEGKNHKGLFPASAVFSTDLHSLGQFIQEGSKVLFETVLTVEIPTYNVAVIESEENIDNLNYLVDTSVHDINLTAFKATTDAHVKVGKVPNIHIEFTKMDAKNFGELAIFFQRAVAMTAYLQGVNPFNQPGVEIYKSNMFNLLGKPE
ncbi:MAG: glucose-6-phosphate isomerase [Mycoplasmataceae bacterium]|nr:glucose-6-phosphate isomerase [Mycoplasmataceae bacterium]